MRIIDLSQPIVDGRESYPGDPPPRAEPLAVLGDDGFRLTGLTMTAHQGTHVDAPSHFLPDGRSIDNLSLGLFFGAAHCIDLAPGGALPDGGEISPVMLAAHSERFRVRTRVLLRSGWSDRDDAFQLLPETFPRITPEAARWIAGRGIGLLGIDWPTPNVVDERTVHETLLNADPPVVLLENLINLRRLPSRFTLIALPLALTGCEASPVRAAAVVEDDAAVNP